MKESMNDLDQQTKEWLDAQVPGQPVPHFTQPAITGYRQLSEEEVSLMNEGKALAEKCGEFVARLRKFEPRGTVPAGFKPGDSLDQRWISIGATDLQRGFMAVIRGIAQPTTF